MEFLNAFPSSYSTVAERLNDNNTEINLGEKAEK